MDSFLILNMFQKVWRGGQSQDGREIGWGHHFLPKRFIKRSFECWATSTKQLLNTGRGHQDPRKAAHSLQKEVGQNIEGKKRDNRVRDWRPILQRELWRRSFQITGNPVTGRSVGSFGISEGNITRKRKKKKKSPQIMCLTTTPRGEVDQTLESVTGGAGQGGTCCILRVRTGLECPEDNLRKLMWDSNPIWGIAREEKKKRKRERERNISQKAVMWSLNHSQNKGLSKYQRTASWLWTGPSPPHRQRQRGRCATARARRQGAISPPETGILHQTVSRLPVASHIFMASWMVDICQEGYSLRSAPQRRHTAHLRQCSHSTPRKPSGHDQGGD